MKLEYGISVPKNLVLNEFNDCIYSKIEGTFEDTSGRYCMVGFDPLTTNQSTIKYIGEIHLNNLNLSSKNH